MHKNKTIVHKCRDVKGTDPLDERGVAQSLRHGVLRDDVMTQVRSPALSVLLTVVSLSVCGYKSSVFRDHVCVTGQTAEDGVCAGAD